jgi:hypothetical protein
MKTVIETAIKALAAKSENAKAPHEAMQFAQAALNLAHTFSTSEPMRRVPPKDVEAVIKAARDVVAWDWSENDSDCVKDMTALSIALNDFDGYGADNGERS